MMRKWAFVIGCLAVVACRTKEVAVTCEADADTCPEHSRCILGECRYVDGGAEVGTSASDVSRDVAIDAPVSDARDAADAADAFRPDVSEADAPGTCGTDGGLCAESGAGKSYCFENRCRECAADDHCMSAARPFCKAGTCASCKEAVKPDELCAKKSTASPYCETTTGRCEACTASAGCSGTKPICRMSAPGAATAAKCGGCEKDEECTGDKLAGVCLPDGSCPLATEVIFVQNRSDCTAEDGSSSKPYCLSQKAVDEAVKKPSGGTVVIRGPMFAKPFTLTTPGKVTVIGKNMASIYGGPYTGVRVSGPGVELQLRSLRIYDSDIGVQADSGATLRMSRCTVEGNKGGILVNGAAFDIVNTIIATNAPTSALVNGTSDDYAGALLFPSTGALIKRFAFNTVVENTGGIGVVCRDTPKLPLSGILLSGNAIPAFGCEIALDSSSTEPPLFGATPYHLSASSPCVDKGPMTLPTDAAFDRFDIDGEPRLKGTRSDCGADEF